MQKSESITELAKALNKTQAKLQVAKKGSENPFFHSKYADLLAVWDACREALTQNGLSVSQLADTDAEGKAVLETILMHESGEWIKGRLPLLSVKADPQAQGSAITYARRYSLSAIIGLCTEEDDDAGAAMERTKPKASMCPIHNVPFKKFEKEGRVWYSHKTEDGWCNKDKKVDPVIEAAKDMGMVVKDTEDNISFANVGEFLTRAKDELGLTKSAVEKITGPTSDITDLTGAWVFLKNSV